MEFVREVSIKRPVSTNRLIFTALGIFAVVSVLIGFACVCGYHVGYRHAVLDAMKTEASDRQVVDPSDSAMWMSYGTDGRRDSWTAPRQPVTVVERDLAGFTVINANDDHVIVALTFRRPTWVEHTGNPDGTGHLHWMDGPLGMSMPLGHDMIVRYEYAPVESSVCDIGMEPVCHSGVTLCVFPDAVEAHLTHHLDLPGACL